MEIVDRSSSRGSFNNPILTRPLPHIAVVSGTGPCSNYSSYSTTHYLSNNFAACTIDGEWRALRGPGFYVYWNQGKLYDNYWSGYASLIVSNNIVYYLTVDGALIALESGNPLAIQPEKEPTFAGDKDFNLIKKFTNIVTDALALIKELAKAKGLITQTNKELALIKELASTQNYIEFNDPHIDKYIGTKVIWL